MNFALISVERARFKQAVARVGILLSHNRAESLAEIKSRLGAPFVIACGFGACKSEMCVMFWFFLLNFLR